MTISAALAAFELVRRRRAELGDQAVGPLELAALFEAVDRIVAEMESATEQAAVLHARNHNLIDMLATETAALRNELKRSTT